MQRIKITFLALLCVALPLSTAFASSETSKTSVKAPNLTAPSNQDNKANPAIATVTSAIDNLPTLIPSPPQLDVHAYVLLDAQSDDIIAAQNADKRVEPASLTKMMTLYIIANALKTHRITLDDKVTISKKAWKTGGSRMFAKVGSEVPVRDLINGIVVASGNDATVAMAEYIGGNEATFVDLMNKTAASLGMKNTHFMDCNGLPKPDHYTTAHDLGTLARAWILNFPEYYKWFDQKWIKYNGIRQPNRNRLLWRDPSVDGMKTGHTNNAGYCLASSGVRNGTRLISIVMGAKTDEGRANNSEALLNYGFRFFETHKLYAADTALVNPRVKFGAKKTTPVGLTHDLYATIPINSSKTLKTAAVLNPNLKAPIKKGQVCGSLKVTLNGKVIANPPLVALDNNPEGGFFTKLLDRIGL